MLGALATVCETPCEMAFERSPAVKASPALENNSAVAVKKQMQPQGATRSYRVMCERVSFLFGGSS